MTATTRRTARLRKYSATGIVTTAVAATALTLAPSPANAAEPAAASGKADKAAADVTAAEKAAKKGYADNLDGWIKESLDIMKAEGIPGTYEGLKRNIIRESAGDPNAINNWDINAQNGVPSIGLLQVIKPTFDQYQVKGTKYDQRDPVANITAAANYAADRYGSIDNVDSAY